MGVILIAFTVIGYRADRSYLYKDHRLKVLTIDESGVIMTDANANRVVMTVEPMSSFMNMKCTIKYLTETISYKNDIDSMESIYVFSDSSCLTEPFLTIQWNDGDDVPSNLTKDQVSERRLVSKLLKYYSNDKPMSVYIGFDIIGLVLLLIGTGLFFYPESFWRFQTMLTVRYGEPTDWAIFMNKLGGIAFVIIAYAGLFAILWA